MTVTQLQVKAGLIRSRLMSPPNAYRKPVLVAIAEPFLPPPPEPVDRRAELMAILKMAPPVFRKAQTTRSIMSAVANHYGFTVEDLMGWNKHRPIAHARQVAMYMVTTNTAMTLAEVGRRFRKDHTTVLYGVRKVRANRIKDPELNAQITTLENQLGLGESRE